MGSGFYQIQSINVNGYRHRNELLVAATAGNCNGHTQLVLHGFGSSCAGVHLPHNPDVFHALVGAGLAVDMVRIALRWQRRGNRRCIVGGQRLGVQCTEGMLLL